MKTIVCTVCPRGCEIEAEEISGIVSVKNYGCARGEAYAKSEYAHPMRLFTSLARVEGGSEPLIAVRSTKSIPLEMLCACVDALREVTLHAPVERYTIVLPNVFGTGADIVTSGCVPLPHTPEPL